MQLQLFSTFLQQLVIFWLNCIFLTTNIAKNGVKLKFVPYALIPHHADMFGQIA